MSKADKGRTNMQDVDSQALAEELDRTGQNEGFVPEEQYWQGDTGTLSFNARRALLHLLKGPYITSDNNKELWQALLNNQRAIKARLSDLFCELVVNSDEGIAFVRNAHAEDGDLPRAVKSQPLTLADTIMVLSLRRELLIDPSSRVFIGQDEMIDQLMHYRPVAHLDESAFRKRLETSWSRLVKAGILRPLETEERCEISPVLKLTFGAEEVRDVAAEFDCLMSELTQEGELATGGEPSSLAQEPSSSFSQNSMAALEEDVDDDDSIGEYDDESDE